MFGQVPRQVIDTLRSIPLFSSCSEAELRAIAALGTSVHVHEGRVLTTQGRSGSEFFLVRSGTASCLIDGEPVAEFGPGDFFGELALLGQTPRTATVTADGDMELIVFSSREFASLLQDSHQVAMSMLRRLADRVHVLEDAAA
jgi:CRP/FNR family transcriptional regulator, cyclic AMP receptor protein